MEVLIMTGVTGFVGSALAVDALKNGYEVVALSRNDHDSKRTLKAIEEASNGYQTEVDVSRLTVLDPNDKELKEKLKILCKDRKTSFFHCAAEMSYSWHNMGNSLNYNVSGAVNLLKMSKELNFDSFNYVSTLFSSIDKEFIPEEIHIENYPRNAYQGSKWMAENHIYFMAKELDMNVRIFRPGAVVGHTKTGWTSGKPFGFYMFLAGVKYFKKKGVKELILNLDPESKGPIIFIDQLTEGMLKCHEGIKDKGCRIVNMANNDNEEGAMKYIGQMMSEHLNMKVSFGKPESFWDYLMDRGVDLNREFADNSFKYDTKALDEYVSEHRPIIKEELNNVVKYFFDHVDLSNPNKKRKNKIKNIYKQINYYKDYIQYKKRNN